MLSDKNIFGDIEQIKPTPFKIGCVNIFDLNFW